MSFLEWCIHETSLYSLLSTGTRDTYLLLASRFLRMFAYGGAALVLAIFLYTAGNNGTQIGTFMTISLMGDAAISYLLTIRADKIGRRKVLMIGSVLMIFSGIVFATTTNYYVLLFAAIVGVITPGAHEVGPFRAVQESTLAQLTPIEARTDVYAWFAVTSTLGMATGLFTGGCITYVMRHTYEYEWKDLGAYQPVFGMYAIVGLAKACLTFFLSERCERNYRPPVEDRNDERETRAPLLAGSDRRQSYTKGPEVGSRIRRIGSAVTTKLSPESRKTLTRLCILFAVNSFASGMLPVTIMSWYVNRWFRWFVTYRVGYAMSVVWLVASAGNLLSASVARRLGLVRTMVLTHLPNAIFLAFIPLAPTWWIGFILLFVSSALGSLDQAPRMAFVAAVFSPEERTAVMGILNLVRTVAAAGGPLVSGYLYEKKKSWLTLLIAAALKISYDIGLLAMFLKTKLPEQDGRPREATVTDVDVGILLSENLARPEEFGIVEDEEMDREEATDRRQHGKVRYEEIEEV